MDDALLVRGFERVGDLAGDALSASSSGERALRRSLGERPLDQLHHQVVRADVVQRADVGMIQRGDGSRFALEALAESFRGDLDGDVAAEARIAAR